MPHSNDRVSVVRCVPASPRISHVAHVNPVQSPYGAAIDLRAHIAAVQRLALVAFLGCLTALVIAVTTARADEAQSFVVPTETVEQMQSVIRAQIDAFRADDAEAAYAFASDPIKMRFPTAGMFVSMVQRGYPAVYAPQSFSFEGSALTERGPAQKGEFVAKDGQIWRGIYTFSAADDGRLLISGVFLRRGNERQI